MLEPSASVALAVIPTIVPLTAFSAIVLVAALVSVGVVTSNSSTSVTAIVKVWVLVEVSELVAVTVMEWEAAVSKLSKVPSSTVTTPVLGSIAKRPPELSVRL